MHSLENLALIHGCVGSSPYQNIGAYGVELQRVCAYVDYVELATGKQVRLTAKECRFGYRDSIFKHEYRGSLRHCSRRSASAKRVATCTNVW